MTILSNSLVQNKVTEQISLDPLTNKTGDIWHVFVKGDFKDMLYGYRFDGELSPEEGQYYNSSWILLDPYAKVSILNSCFIYRLPSSDIEFICLCFELGHNMLLAS